MHPYRHSPTRSLFFDKKNETGGGVIQYAHKNTNRSLLMFQRIITFTESYFNGYVLSFMVIMGLYAVFYSAPLLTKKGFYKEALWPAAGGWFWTGLGILVFIALRLYNLIVW